MSKLFRWAGPVLAVLLLAVSCVPGTASVSYPYGGLLAETDWLSQHLADPQVRVVDVRGGNSYEEGHIPGAVHLNMGDMVDTMAPVRGAHDYFTLRLLGHPKLSLYSGSWEEWGNDPTLPIEK